MNFEKKTAHFRSSNGFSDVEYYFYIPTACKPSAVLQISHGMCEYIERYEHFIDFMCKNGFIVCGNDHIGHGFSVHSEDDYGFFAYDNGWRYLVKDVVRLTRIAQNNYPELPYFILGHSMGSLILRTVIAKYSEFYDGAIILGTTQLGMESTAALAALELIEKLYGGYYCSKKLSDMMLGISMQHIDEPETEYDWMSRDMKHNKNYASDPKCTFLFTTSAMIDLVKLTKYVSLPDWAEKVSSNLPILVASGSEDPVGAYGKCPQEVFDKLNNAGCCDLELRIYPQARHELLNETNKDEVYSDILEWLSEHINETEADINR